jgi:hypothetical protein
MKGVRGEKGAGRNGTRSKVAPAANLTRQLAVYSTRNGGRGNPTSNLFGSKKVAAFTVKLVS